MKHYIDIQNIRESENVLTKSNTGAFFPGDIISITEKIDGSNASFTYEDGKLLSYSRKQELNFNNTLAGFWNWVQELSPDDYKEESDYIFFGEWLRKNKITYDKECINKFYLFDIYNKKTGEWMPQNFVKEQARKHNLNYINELYFGPFISWDHCRKFMNSSIYGDTQEGCVVKNQTRLNDPEIRQPVYLKLVNDSFKERMKVREVDPEKEAEKERVHALIESIVTPRRVEKMIFNLRDEGVLPEVLEPKDMKLVAQNLPKRIYEDCIKEEPETVAAAGEMAGKAISGLTMKIARGIILGG